MAIVSADLKEYKSNATLSDGQDISATEVVDNVDNNLFTDITGDEAAAGGTEYRKVFRKNTHGSLTWQNVVSWLQSQPTNAALSFGYGINHTDDADGAQGNMTPFGANAVAAIISDGADTRQVTIVGEDASGNRQQETLSFIWYGKKYTGASLGNAEGGDMASKAAGMKNGDIASAGNFGLWYRLTWPTTAGAVTANSTQVKSEGDTAA